MNSDSLDEGSNPFIQAFVQGAQSRAVTYTQNAHPDSVQKRQGATGAYTGNVCTDILNWDFYIRKLSDTVQVSSRLLETV